MTSKVLLAIAGVVAIAPLSRAQPSDSLQQAQAAFDQAQQAYAQGKYDEAAKGFQDAYAARPFPQFLYNVAASFHMKGKQLGDAAAYRQAIEFYRKYLAEAPAAEDRDQVEKTIAVLEAEAKRLEAGKIAEAMTGSGGGSGTGTGTGTAAAPAPSRAVEELGDVKVHGVVVVATDPPGATIYVDDNKTAPLGQTPWSGSLDGQHRLIIEKPGYKPVETTVTADASKLVQVIASLSQEPARAHEAAKGPPAGRLAINGDGIEDSTIFIDGKEACARGPCIRELPEGDHQLVVSRPGYKPYAKTIAVQARTETDVKVSLSPEPGHADAVWAYIVTGVFAGGGIFLGARANQLHDDLQHEIARGMPPPDSNDPRFLRGKLYAIGADVSFGVAAIAGLTAIYYTFRTKGSPSSASVELRAVSLRPEVGPGYAGLGMEARW